MRHKKMHGTEWTANLDLKEMPRMTTKMTFTTPAPKRYGFLYLALLVAGLLMVTAAINGFKDMSLEIEQAQYCRMVAMHERNPELGWPDYEKAYDVACNADGTVKKER